MFIVFDGPDGSGKSTLIKKISVEMQLDPFFEEYAVFTTREPGSTSIGKKIRKILLDAEETPAGLTEFLLFLADRAEHYEKFLKPALKNKRNIVISDRYWESSIVYQCFVQETIDIYDMARLHAIVTDFLLPDLLFIIDSETPHGLKHDRLDNMGQDFREKIRKQYRSLLNSMHLMYPKIYIDTTEKNWEQYVKDIIKHIKKYVIKHKK